MPERVLESGTISYTRNAWNTVRVLVNDETISVWLNDSPLFPAPTVDATHSTGAIGLQLQNMSGIYFDDLTVEGFDGPDADDQVSRVISYEGFFSIDGLAGSGTEPMRFTLYRADGTRLWSEEWIDVDEVPMRDGFFNVLLGSLVSFDSVLYDADELFLGIELKDSGNNWFPLEGRERLAPVMWTIWSTHAESVSGAGDVSVGGVVTATNFVADELSTFTLYADSSGVGDGNIAVTGGMFVDSGGIMTGSTLNVPELYCDHINLDGSVNIDFADTPNRSALTVTSTQVIVNPENDFTGVTWITPDIHTDADCDGVTIACGGTVVNGTLAVGTASSSYDYVEMGPRGSPNYVIGVIPSQSWRSVFLSRWRDHGTNTSAATAHINFNCWFGGYEFTWGTIDENGTGIAQAYVDGSDRGYFDWTSSNNVSRSMLWICAAKDLNIDVTSLGDWGDYN